MLAVAMAQIAKGLAMDLEVTGSGPVDCYFPFSPKFLTMISPACLSRNVILLLQDRLYYHDNNI